ncbi:hypothetical protein R2601_15900 [Salipiger bermudensis HTCC2601]|uniref:Uncharacterized protein n=1 Tax=Salipiger bermudensis (strain DSM 26914 / JCM 13377 / KCTC 12554 / HTCC2601) TaxID=314265 RepID=Q0FJB8_SALBH|nr:hypothetical protein R2601_15900 [Salipiger bermudensis HTCC2601]
MMKKDLFDSLEIQPVRSRARQYASIETNQFIWSVFKWCLC